MGRLKGSSAYAIGRCFRRYNRNSLYHTDHIFHSHKGLGQGSLAVFLITLPVYYMIFGVLAMDGTVILTEFLYGLPYILTGLLAWRMRSKAALLVVAIAWLSHGFYDFYHDILFINPGVFSWYPAFCAIVDVTVAGYMLLSYKKLTMQPA